VPQRDIPLDPRLVSEANDELAGAESADQSVANFLERLLVPEDIRGYLYSRADRPDARCDDRPRALGNDRPPDSRATAQPATARPA
jgi:hypothetical protein